MFQWKILIKNHYLNILEQLDMNGKDKKNSLCMFHISDSKPEKYLAILNLKSWSLNYCMLSPALLWFNLIFLKLIRRFLKVPKSIR